MMSDSIGINSYVVTSPYNLIKTYLGIYLDHKYKYICPHIRGDECGVTVEASVKSGKKHTEQMAIINKVIELLRNEKFSLYSLRLAPSNSEQGLTLVTGSFENSIEDPLINSDDNFCIQNDVNDVAAKAGVLTAIFYDRHKPFKNLAAETFHRNQLANAFHWHLAENFHNEPVNVIDNLVHIEIKPSKPQRSPEKPRRASSPHSAMGKSEIKSSQKTLGITSDLPDSKLKRSTNGGNRFQFHLSLHDLTPSAGPNSPKRGDVKLSPNQRSRSEKELMRMGLLELVSLSSLNNCRRRWIDSFMEQKEKTQNKQRSSKHLNVNDMPWDEKEYLLIEKHQIFSNPMMQQLVQCELSKDINFDLNPHTLMQDIHRTLAYIDKNYHTGLESRSMENILNSKELDAESLEKLNKFSKKEKDIFDEEVKKFDAEVSYFYYLLKRLLQEIGKKNPKEQTVILSMWKDCVQAQFKSSFDNHSFVSAGMVFFETISKGGSLGQKLAQLLSLLRQKFYMHPFSVIHEVTPDIPLTLLNNDPRRLVQFEFKDGCVEFSTFIKAIPAIEPVKWDDPSKAISGCEFELTSIMRADINELKWRSTVIVKVNITRNTKRVPMDIQQHIIDPLVAVGFDVDIGYSNGATQTRFTKSS